MPDGEHVGIDDALEPVRTEGARGYADHEYQGGDNN
jgi:hypothetical protein